MPQNAGPKPRRQKKRKSRTEVSSDISSDSEPETSQSKSPSPTPQSPQAKGPEIERDPSEVSTGPEAPASSQEPSASQVDAVFTKFYMERATREFEDDLEQLRTSEDFRSESLPMLIAALQGGTSLFSEGEKRRVVNAWKGEGEGEGGK
ncbi:hypothetical protein QTJ16_001965 [Diplocarpon rosae]|uniref:Ribosome assembly protein 3 n=1 Tax=Diplocarpon rosae TaxID=946125 RepID=A0AAD9WEM6_9HELO|nr:hypothetical protein QTJ16_001965 [Diplocarpon rosae]